MWEYHIRLCLILLFIAIPIAVADFILLKDKGGGWISLDFRGVITGAYLMVVVLHIIISTVYLKYFSSQSVGTVHGLSFIVSIILFCVGVYGYYNWQKANDRKKYQATLALRAKLFPVLSLTEWMYTSDSTEIIVSVSTSESGRFSCNAKGYEQGEYGEQLFHSDNVKQRKVEKSERFTHIIPINWVKKGKPCEVEITLYLFADQTGSAGKDVIKIYTTQFTTEDDGHYFYESLPPAKESRQDSTDIHK